MKIKEMIKKNMSKRELDLFIEVHPAMTRAIDIAIKSITEICKMANVSIDKETKQILWNRQFEQIRIVIVSEIKKNESDYNSVIDSLNNYLENTMPQNIAYSLEKIKCKIDKDDIKDDIDEVCIFQ